MKTKDELKKKGTEPCEEELEEDTSNAEPEETEEEKKKREEEEAKAAKEKEMAEKKQKDDYPYPYPYPSGKAKGIDKKGRPYPAAMKEKKYPYPYPYPETKKHAQAKDVEELRGTCKHSDTCPLKDKKSSWTEAVEIATGCSKAKEFGCPIFFGEVEVMNFAELENIEIFATGTHRGRTFTRKDLDQIAKNFSEFGAMIQPPLVLGHDEHQEILQNSGLPSLGWLTEVEVREKDGDAVLVGKFSDVPEMAKNIIQEKRYKRISAELYEDFQEDGKSHGLALRRVALLGADIPEVKTLADVVALSEASSLVYAFSEGGTEMDPNQDLVKRLAEVEKRNKELSDALAKETVEKHRTSISSFCEELKREGRFLPRWDEMGIKKFLETLDSSKTAKFSEAKEAKQLSALEWMKEFMRALPQLVKLEEIATQNPELIASMKQSGETASKALDLAAQTHMAEELKKGRKLTYVEAVREVAKANPALVE